MAVIQLDFTDIDTLPAWVWIEWEIKGGIRAVINTWKGGLLRKYIPGNPEDYFANPGALDLENYVLNKIHREARALARYSKGHYRDVLNEIENTIFKLERRCMSENPHLHGRYRYQWIADELYQRGHGHWSWALIETILGEITGILADVYELELEEKMLMSVKALREVWNEVRSESLAIAA